MSQYLVRRRRVVVVAPTKAQKQGGGGWLALGGLIAAVAVFANWNGGSPHDGRTLVIATDAAHACRTEVTVRGHSFPALLDTGAVGMGLVFGSNHATALGFAPRSLSYSHTYSSANGDGRETIVRRITCGCTGCSSAT